MALGSSETIESILWHSWREQCLCIEFRDEWSLSYSLFFVSFMALKVLSRTGTNLNVGLVLSANDDLKKLLILLASSPLVVFDGEFVAPSDRSFDHQHMGSCLATLGSGGEPSIDLQHPTHGYEAGIRTVWK